MGPVENQKFWDFICSTNKKALGSDKESGEPLVRLWNAPLFIVGIL